MTRNERNEKEPEWFTVASMDKRILKDIRMLCETYGIRWWLEDTPLKPFTVHMKTTHNVYQSILRRCGFQVGRVI